MHKIFACPEILDEILSYSSHHTNTITARVCRIWFTYSIQNIWDTVDLNDAISVLLPLNSKHKDDGLQRHSIAQSWDRFFIYSKYVRHLKCLDIKEATLKPVILWRPSTDLFPSRLTAIDWKGAEKDIDFIPPFLTSTLRRLDISLDVLQKPMVDALCKTIAMRSPSLRVLKLRISSMTQFIASHSLDELFSHLTRLVFVVIPVHFMTTKIFTTLSQLPDLKGLILFTPPGGAIDYVEDIMEKRITDGGKTEESGPFQSLQDFLISDQRNFTITKAFKSVARISRLVCLDCYSQLKNPDEITNVMESVHVVCPNLQEIILRGEVTGTSTPDTSLPRLPWKVIQKLLECQHLHSLSIFNFTIDMGLDNISTIATNRSFWQAVNLSPSEPLSFQALIPFAQHCPELEELGLVFDDDLGFPDLETYETDVSFASLTTLDVGDSDVNSPVEVGIFLSNICGNTLSINFHGGSEGESSWTTVEKIVNSVNATVSARIRKLNRKATLLQDD